MEWHNLICDKRFGLEDIGRSDGGVRSDFERDYDRLVFSSPFRRLQNKTQVFPLPGSIFVHNRLTHSIEVACVGRSLANEVSKLLRLNHLPSETLSALDYIGEITAAACLAHDLGNPPFGHSGEKAISAFFTEGSGNELHEMLTPTQWTDFTRFDGNANSFRLLTHRFNGRRPGGFAMTYSTLAAVVKYPYSSSLSDSSKFGFFDSDRDDFVKVADTLGMRRLDSPPGTVRYARHPLVYLVEAADDICYEIMDIEDAHKLGILTLDETISLLIQFFEPERQQRIKRALDYVEDPNEKVGYLRSCAIGALVQACSRAFVDNERAILQGEFSDTLIETMQNPQRSAYEACSALSWKKIYCAPDVVDIELAGNRIITFLMEKLIHAVRYPEQNYSRLLLSKVPNQYEISAPTLYGKIQAVLDHISGMTDVYALELYRRLNAIALKINN